MIICFYFNLGMQPTIRMDNKLFFPKGKNTHNFLLNKAKQKTKT